MTETIYKMDTLQQNLLETFLTGRNNALLFSKGNVDANGKATIVDPKLVWGQIIKIYLIAENS